MANTSIWDKLDYNRNAVIEASAGTGKTYTLEHIVEKLVREKGYDIRSLLLVTFTEKAAGELKERIRKMLKGSESAKHLDEATICTIHAFCREVLAAYPFESGIMMGMDIGGSDKALCAKAVHNVLVSDEFRKAYADRFELGMAYWATTKKPEDADRVDTLMLAKEAAQKLEKLVSTDGFGKWRMDFEIQKQSLSDLSTAISLLPKEQDCGPGRYVLNHADRLSQAQETYFTELDDNLEIVLKKRNDPERMLVALKAIAKQRMDFKLAKWDGIKAGVPFCEKTGFESYGRIKSLAPQCAKYLQTELLMDLVRESYFEFLRLKSRSSSVTFDDLIRETAHLVDAATGPNATDAQGVFVKRMRDHYRLALVDEFQDTDAKQWQIFKKLFADIGHLIVVGDPKQAIYGWRGADLATYMSAKVELLGHDGQFESLKYMYRSTEEMVSDFHTLFSSGWFNEMEAGGVAINYERVEFPGDDAPESVKGFRYPDGEKAVELLEAGNGLVQFIENSANEMIRLHKEWDQYMDWEKMCVLVRSNDDGHLVQQELLKKNIPCRFYHEKKFFKGEEAESVLALLDYLSMPRSMGNLSALLLTPLFGFKPEELDKRLEDGDSAFDGLCERWRNYSDKRDWIRLFESIMCETKAAVNPAGYRQVFDQLLTDYGRSTTVAELADALRALRSGDASAGENGSVRNKASEVPAVQVMTMHAAKGLEFNAVFVAAGFSGLSNDKSIDDRPRQEKAMEVCRLFYVALTRAAFKLYLPWSEDENRLDQVCKQDSALSEYLGRAIGALCREGGVAGRMRDPGEQELEPQIPQEQDLRERPPRRGMKGWRFKWDSFSSLNHHSAKKPIEPEGQKPTLDEGQNNAGNKNLEEEQKQKSLVPKGALSGTVFHEVMEALCKNSKDKGEVGFEIGKENDFEKLVTETEDKKSPLLELVRRRLAANGVVNKAGANKDESTAASIARMAWNALRTELVFGVDNKFKLCEIPLKDRRGTCRKAEVNFVLDESNLGGVREEGAGALNGSIDLLVRRDDGYYIVDWKTNALDDYEDATVATAMDEAGYHLQYKIYSLAAEKWLGENAVKGVAYLFVRGGETGTNASGKFVHTIKEGERAEFAKAFRDRIDASDKEEADKEKEEL